MAQAGAGVLAVGDGARRYAGLLEPLVGVTVAGPSLASPRPEVLVALAAGRLAAGDRGLAGGRGPARLPARARRPDQLGDPQPAGPAGPGVTLAVSAMRRRDLRRVMAIEDAVFPEPWSLAIFTSELALRRGRAYRVARQGRAVVGYFGLMFVGDEAHVTTVAVAPDHQDRGVGTELFLAAVRVALDHGARRHLLGGGGGQRRGPRPSTAASASPRSGCARATTSAPGRTPW